MARRLPPDNPKEFLHPEKFDNLRPGYSRLIPDIAILFGRAKCNNNAASTIQLIQSDELRQEAKDHLAAEYANQGDLAAAADLISEQSSVDARYAVALGYLQAGQQEKAKDLVGSIDLYRQSSLVTAAAELINYSFEYPKLGAVIRAVARPSIFWMMEDDDARLMIIRELVRRGKTSAAKSLIRSEMTASADDEAEENADWRRGRQVEAYIAIHDFTAARDTARRIKSKKDRAAWLGKVASTSDSIQFSKATLQMARAIVQRCTTKNRTSDCWMMWLDLARHYAEIGDIDAAVDLSRQPAADEEFTLSEIAVARAVRLDLTNAEKVITLMPQAEGSPHYQHALEAIAVSQVRAAEYSRAQANYKKLRNEFIQSTIMVAVGARSAAKPVTLEWLELARQLKDDEMQARAIQPLMASLARTDDAKSAYAWMKEFDANLKPLARARALVGVAQGILGIAPGENWLTLVHLWKQP